MQDYGFQFQGCENASYSFLELLVLPMDDEHFATRNLPAGARTWFGRCAHFRRGLQFKIRNYYTNQIPQFGPLRCSTIQVEFSINRVPSLVKRMSGPITALNQMTNVCPNAFAFDRC